MSSKFPLIARIDRYAQRQHIKPATVVRKITDDPRGYKRLKNKLESIAAVEKWLDEQEQSLNVTENVTEGTPCQEQVAK